MAAHALSMPAPSRRSVFALAALPILASPAVAADDDVAQFRAWDRACIDAWSRANALGGSDEHTRRWCLRAHDFEQKIFETETRSREAMDIKLRTMQRIPTESNDDLFADTFAQVRAFIQAAL